MELMVSCFLQVHGFRIPDVLEPHLDSIEKNANLLMYFAFCGQHE